jgi:hypothetical protein
MINGRGNTVKTLSLSKNRADELGIRNIVVASSSGRTGVVASEVYKDYNLVVVTSVTGYMKPNEVRMKPEFREAIEAGGGVVLTATHAFGALGRAVHNRFGAIQIDEIISHVLRLFSEGVKVGCEIACMAVDAGYFSTQQHAYLLRHENKGDNLQAPGLTRLILSFRAALQGFP